VRRWWLDEELAASWVAPRPAETHKGHAGHTAVLAGSPGKTGAAAMICEGAGRVGAGLVTLFAPKSLNSIMEVKLTEAMTLPIAETAEGTAGLEALEPILEFLADKDVLAAGPGLSTSSETGRLLEKLLPELPCPAVLDADAVTILSGRLDLLQKAGVPLILTPHPGEMARLIQGSTRDVQADRVAIAERFSREHGVVLVLKGHRTVIAAPDGRLAVNGSGNPAMASGGMGDILTGSVAGFVSQGFDPFVAACLGVYVHGAAADECIGRDSTRGLMATDLSPLLPRIVGRLEKGPCES
jgi:NAD(P)H-hydrate epimerase